jgi:hypothetical protein
VEVKILIDTSAYSDLARGHSRLTDRVRRAEAVTGAELLSSDTHFQFVEGLVWTDPGKP